jgi:UDP-N-acetylmuramate: L-alanyl-gamma-D-glutamyl-meso-diaminopimelate ligase
MVTNVTDKYLKMKIHILGICGTFMGGLAQILVEKGYTVSGSDKQFYPPMSDQLQSLGIKMIKGYEESYLPSADLYVIGNALSRGNPSVEHILNQKLEYTSGPKMLGEMIRDRTVISVSGTHGKTSTSFLICEIFQSQGIDIGFLVGGVSDSFDNSARLGSSKYFVIEADEYDSAFF